MVEFAAEYRTLSIAETQLRGFCKADRQFLLSACCTSQCDCGPGRDHAKAGCKVPGTHRQASSRDAVDDFHYSAGPGTETQQAGAWSTGIIGPGEKICHTGIVISSCGRGNS